MPRTSTYNLQSAYLGGTPTSGKYHVVNLQGANLSGANLQSADLGLANLQDTKLIGANLQSASLGASNLQGARFSRANLQGAILHGTDLSPHGWVNPGTARLGESATKKRSRRPA